MNEAALIVDAATIGGGIAIALQLLKALPKEWLEKILSQDKDTQKARMQAGVFGVVVVVNIVRMYLDGGIHFDNLHAVISAMVMSLTAAYVVYQAVLKRLADQFPGWFHV